MFTLFFYGKYLLDSGVKNQALEVAKLNQQRHPDDLFYTHLALARACTATGDKPTAITEWELALQHAPDNRKASIPQFQATLKKLKEG